MLWADKLAFFAALFLLIILLCALFGPFLLEAIATKQNLRAGRAAVRYHPRNALCSRRGCAGQAASCPRHRGSAKYHLVAAAAVLASSVVGTALGLVAGYSRSSAAQWIMRLGDVIMSFPSLLLAVIVLYMLEPSVTNIVLVLAITRIPIYLRTTRAEVLEVRERMFVQAAKVMGASYWRIVFHHILPVIFPTLVTIATLDFAFVMLAESSLSFLGIGIQAPEITWGLMVAQGRPYLTNAWWLSFWPGLAIILTTLSLNLLSNWLRIALDPTQRWRLEMRGRKNG